MKENILNIENIVDIIQDRKEKMSEGSFVISVLNGTTERAAQKVGEEGVEVTIAATRFGITGEIKDRDELIGEVADLWFQSLVLLAKLDIPFIRIKEKLTQRHAEKILKKGGD